MGQTQTHPLILNSLPSSQSGPELGQPRWSSVEAAPTFRLAEDIFKLERRVHLALRNIETAKDSEDYVFKVAEQAKARAQTAGTDEVWVAKLAQDRALQCFRDGIHPVVLPSAAEVAAAKAMVRHPDSLFHFGVAGLASDGRLSLINAIRGLHSSTAQVGVPSAPPTIGRYLDPNPSHSVVWYDIPKVDITAQPSWKYFNELGLFIFDGIVILYDNGFSQTDIIIMKNCQRFQIPTYIVRLQEHNSGTSVQHSEARPRFVADINAADQRKLEEAGLPKQAVYIVSNTAMLAMMRQQELPWSIISGHRRLIEDILADVRCRNDNSLEKVAEKSGPAEHVLEMRSGSSRHDTEPVFSFTAEEVTAAKTRVQYQDGLIHIAITGVAGSGKSSLVNALRGVHNNHPSAARTGVAETTSAIGRYPDPSPDCPFVWYDIPGAGTIAQTDKEYFINQSLFVFDYVIVLIDNRVTQTDIAILTHCRKLCIPTYVVRSKADVHIGNIINDMGSPNDGSDDDDSDQMPYQSLYVQARGQFITITRDTVQRSLREANLSDQSVYIVSNKILLMTMRNRRLSPERIDELKLKKDLFEGGRLGRELRVI